VRHDRKIESPAHVAHPSRVPVVEVALVGRAVNRRGHAGHRLAIHLSLDVVVRAAPRVLKGEHALLHERELLGREQHARMARRARHVLRLDRVGELIAVAAGDRAVEHEQVRVRGMQLGLGDDGDQGAVRGHAQTDARAHDLPRIEVVEGDGLARHGGAVDEAAQAHLEDRLRGNLGVGRGLDRAQRRRTAWPIRARRRLRCGSDGRRREPRERDDEPRAMDHAMPPDLLVYRSAGTARVSAPVGRVS
jgi:hypothetical protein